MRNPKPRGQINTAAISRRVRPPEWGATLALRSLRNGLEKTLGDYYRARLVVDEQLPFLVQDLPRLTEKLRELTTLQLRRDREIEAALDDAQRTRFREEAPDLD